MISEAGRDRIRNLRVGWSEKKTRHYKSYLLVWPVVNVDVLLFLEFLEHLFGLWKRFDDVRALNSSEPLAPMSFHEAQEALFVLYAVNRRAKAVFLGLIGRIRFDDAQFNVHSHRLAQPLPRQIV